MPRKARIDAPGALHHIIVRGIEKRQIVYDDIDRNRFLDRLGKNLTETQTPCFAWAIMPNHVHLLLKTASTSLATVMRRLLTGYVVTFNRRHRRHGPLFQNRYKSILCQEDRYLLELVRYIHLNPLRAKIVDDFGALSRFPYAGHSVLMARTTCSWQSVDDVLALFDKKKSVARKRYEQFVKKGVDQGRRPELTGGGLLRSVGGWSVLKQIRRSPFRIKGDERILGDGDFVESVLRQADEKLERRNRLEAMGVNLDTIAHRAAKEWDVSIPLMLSDDQTHRVVKARSLFCYWAVRELGVSATSLARQLSLSQPAVSISVRRGEKIAEERGLKYLKV